MTKPKDNAMPPDGNGDWNQWSKHVLITLTKHGEWLKDINEKLDAALLSNEGRVTRLETKIWAIVGGGSLIVSAVVTFVLHLILESGA